MKQLRIVNSQRQTMAIVQWQPPGHLHVQTLEPPIESDLRSIVDTAIARGLPFYTSKQVEQEGHDLLVDEQILINVDDARFLSALADAINRYQHGQQRIFGILEELPAEEV